MIQFFNTLSGKVEPLNPINPNEVGMYTCGPTVYDFAHIGNFRAFVFEDLLRRVLEAKGLQVKHVMNITDVDDKTIAGSVKEGKKLEEYTEKYTQAFNEDLSTLNILVPTQQPLATQEMESMIELVQKLVDKGVAYESEGSVYYRVSEFKDYCKLSKKKLEMNRDSVRVDNDEYDKEEGADFVLWKGAKEGEPSWDSPWGKGRPGWHLECSAMSMKYLSETFDIHAGGEDLIFPHHENEIAQSEAATGKPFVNAWIHCKFLLVDGEKMSKSKGNFYTLRDLLDKGYDPMAIRFLLLSTHYRSPLNFTLDGLKEAGDFIKKLDDAYWQCLSLLELCSEDAGSDASWPELDEVFPKVQAALENDLNVSEALASVLIGVKTINKTLVDKTMDSSKAQAAIHFFKQVDEIFGFDVAGDEEIPESIGKQIEERFLVRSHDDFKTDSGLQTKCDALRDEIQEGGWLIKDGKLDQRPTVKKRRRKWD